MGLHGKLIAAIEYKAGGDVFHDLFRQDPQHFCSATPDKIQGCDLHEGDQFGLRVGAIIEWSYTHDGKEKKTKELIQFIDEEKKLIAFKVVEGDLTELYKSLVITNHVETNDGIDLVTWTLEYEMFDEENAKHPISLLSYFIDITKDVENHYLAKG